MNVNYRDDIKIKQKALDEHVMFRDMALFVDVNEQEYIRFFPRQAYETLAILKKERKYFMFSTYTTIRKPNPDRFAVSEDIMLV